MVSSILTNNGAMTALQSLKATQKNLLDTQNRISTGLKVSTAKDNAATWAVATSMRAEIANFKQVSENLSVSSGVVSTAAAGTEQIADLISKIRESVTSVQDGVKDSATVQAAIDEYVAQIDSIIGSSAFKGVNLINNSRSGDEKILASVNADGSNLVPSYITVAQQNLTMSAGGALEGLDRLTVERAKDSYSYAAPTGTVDVGDKLSFTFKLDGKEKVASFTATTTSLSDLMTGLKNAINSAAGAGNAFAEIGANGELLVDAELATDVVTFDGETALAKALDTDNDIVLGAAVDKAPQAPKFSYGLAAGAPAVGAVYSFEFEVEGQRQIASYTALTGDDNAAVLAGLKEQINLAAGGGNTIASIDERTGKLVVDASLASGAVTFEGEDALKLKGAAAAGTLAASGATTQTRALAGIIAAAGNVSARFTINGVGHTVTQAAAATTMTAGEAATFVTNINAAAGFNFAYLNDAGTGLVFDQSLAPSAVTGFLVTDDAVSTTVDTSSAGASAGYTYDVAALANVAADERVETLSFSFTNAAGAAQTSTVSRANVQETDAEMLGRLVTDINSKKGSGGDIAFLTADGQLYVDAERSGDTDTAFTAASALQVTKSDATGVATEQTPVSSTDYSDLLARLKTIETAVLSAGAAFGAAQTRIDLQKDFMDKLVDTLTSGVGALVDADMSEEAARLQALQVQEQLGTQALSIANQAPQSILSLFRG
ncbi:MAG: hypothetical protein DI635_13225 [Pseudoxanthomonas suwonensis]|nr:MAG: hypothetical protein DI635_13225 [Pseudoxanthomonas suwonensis]